VPAAPIAASALNPVSRKLEWCLAHPSHTREQLTSSSPSAIRLDPRAPAEAARDGLNADCHAIVPASLKWTAKCGSLPLCKCWDRCCGSLSIRPLAGQTAICSGSSRPRLELGSAALAYGLGCGQTPFQFAGYGFKHSRHGSGCTADLVLKLAFDRQFLTHRTVRESSGAAEDFSIRAFSHKFRIAALVAHRFPRTMGQVGAYALATGAASHATRQKALSVGHPHRRYFGYLTAPIWLGTSRCYF